jgi:hypothetical protein
MNPDTGLIARALILPQTLFDVGVDTRGKFATLHLSQAIEIPLHPLLEPS